MTLIDRDPEHRHCAEFVPWPPRLALVVRRVMTLGLELASVVSD